MLELQWGHLSELPLLLLLLSACVMAQQASPDRMYGITLSHVTLLLLLLPVLSTTNLDSVELP